MKKIRPFELIEDRIKFAKEDSDTAYFLHLMYSAEQLVKLVTAGYLAFVENDSQRHRYSQEYRLVRADGIGEWSAVLDEILVGPTSHYLYEDSREAQKELTELKKNSSWQYRAISLLNESLKIIEPKTEALPTKVSGRNWFSLFARFRNKTRGHGAISPENCSRISPLLHTSIKLFYENLSILSISWVYIKRNLNGKFKVLPISLDTKVFDYLKSDKNQNLADGVYLFAGEPRLVRLISSDSNLEDFYFPNGSFGNNTYECLSYISDDKIYLDVSHYATPPGELPKSQTEGIGRLELMGESFTNIPNNPINYIERNELEEELRRIIHDERHPVITLIGRGGIGKTSLALHVLRGICDTKSFPIIVWLSARDIDLLVEGAKAVQPNVLTINDISREFAEMLGLKQEKGGLTAKEQMEKELTKSDLGPILFVLDNFETVVNPKDVYNWLNTFIRLPNKILITTRFREFKGDYPIEVHGMNYEQFTALIVSVSNEIGIPEVVEDHQYMTELFSQSDGHPYVAKILLGERLRNKKSSNIRVVLAGKDDILTALFERTYNNLSPLSRRIFLTVANWRSVIPEVALEAVLLRSEIQPVDIEDAIEELIKFSLVESISSSIDGSYFISVPLSAAIFGKRKLSVDPLKVAIEADTLLLHYFGVGTMESVNQGLKPRVEKLFHEVAKRIGTSNTTYLSYEPILEFVCTKHHSAWLLLASLYEEENNIPKAIHSVQRFLEIPVSDRDARIGWSKLSRLYQMERDWQGEINAMVEYSLIPGTSLSELSNIVNAINRLFKEKKSWVDTLEKKISIEKVTKVFEYSISNSAQASGDDYSRLAWLFVHMGLKEKARDIVSQALKTEPSNYYCTRLSDWLR